MGVAERVNSLPAAAARDGLSGCCGARRWVDAMLAARPFASDRALFETAEQAWWTLSGGDWLEAFAQHPRIGERDKGDARARSEQAGTAAAAAATRRALAAGNRTYEARFGHVFLVCATGRSADDMLHELERRLGNSPAVELRIAAQEQAKITRLRLEKLVST